MNISSPLVSVVIPTYNAEKTIRETLKSVLDQSYSNLVIYVVDDCSTDNTIEIVDSLVDIRVNLIRSSKNSGFCSNWNKCLSFCEGDFFKLLPHDDTLVKTSIEKMVNIMLLHEELVIVGSLRNIINERSTFIMKRGHLIHSRYMCNYEEFITEMTLTGTNPIGEPGSMLFRSSVIKKNNLKFSDKYELFIDVDFYMKLLQYGECYLLNEYLYNFRVWKNSYSVQNQKLQLLDTKQFFKEKIYKHTFLSKWQVQINKVSIYKNFFFKRIFYMFMVQ